MLMWILIVLVICLLIGYFSKIIKLYNVIFIGINVNLIRNVLICDCFLINWMWMCRVIVLLLNNNI